MYLPRELTLARRIVALGGWITAGYYNSASEVEIAARDAMLVDGRLRARCWDRINIVELTAAGQAWLSEHPTD